MWRDAEDYAEQRRLEAQRKAEEQAWEDWLNGLAGTCSSTRGLYEATTEATTLSGQDCDATRSTARTILKVVQLG